MASTKGTNFIDAAPTRTTVKDFSVMVKTRAELRAEFTDALAQAVQKFEAALDKLRDDMEVREAVAEQRGQLKTMMSALGVEPIDMSDMIRKLRTRLEADIQELVDEAIAPLSKRIAPRCVHGLRPWKCNCPCWWAYLKGPSSAAPIPASWARSIAWAIVPARGAAPARVCARVLRM
jgi:hypothetical protein